jgi:hypothetical protein
MTMDDSVDSTNARLRRDLKAAQTKIKKLQTELYKLSKDLPVVEQASMVHLLKIGDRIRLVNDCCSLIPLFEAVQGGDDNWTGILVDFPQPDYIAYFVRKR